MILTMTQVFLLCLGRDPAEHDFCHGSRLRRKQRLLAQDLSHLESFWKIRETTNAAVAATGYTYKYDISLAIPEFCRMFEAATQGAS